jgi:hypothetical protein
MTLLVSREAISLALLVSKDLHNAPATRSVLPSRPLHCVLSQLFPT